MKPSGTQIIAEFINCSNGILNDEKILEQTLKTAIKKVGLKCKKIVSHHFYPLGVTTIAIISESHIAIHTYPEVRHASIDIFTCSLNPQICHRLLRLFKNILKPGVVRFIEIIRGTSLEINKKLILSKKTKFQQIDIIENDDFERMLFLDKDLQIDEKDAHIYNKSLVAPLRTTRKKLQKVAILGGGDGGVLQELLKLKPAKVFLIDIDGKVIKYSKRFLSTVCKNAFNNQNVKVVISDANEFLKSHQGFDAIICDLTMDPKSYTKQSKINYFSSLFSKINKSINKGGLISLQCCSEFDTATLRFLKRILANHFKNIVFKKVFIPSFYEGWIFASAKKYD